MTPQGDRNPRRVLIFGGARGIGAAVAHAFARAGDKVVIVARTASEVSATAASLGASGAVGDITDSVVVDEIMDAAGELDVIVNAAAIQGGRGAMGPLWDTDPASFARVIDVNLVGTYNVLRAALRRMRPRRSGTVILFSGGGSTGPRPGLDAYGASKTAVLRLAESAQGALDDEDCPVRIFTIAPGAVATAMTQELLANADVVPGEAAMASEVTAGEAGVSPNIAAELCLFLTAPEAAPLAGRLVHAREDYRGYVNRMLGPDAGRLRRANYPNA